MVPNIKHLYRQYKNRISYEWSLKFNRTRFYSKSPVLSDPSSLSEDPDAVVPVTVEFPEVVSPDSVELSPFVDAESVWPFVADESVWPFVVVESVWPSVVAESLWPFVVADSVWPFVVADSVWSFVVADSVWPFVVADSV